MIPYEDRHKLRVHDFDVLKRFKFQYHPIGFKFFNTTGICYGMKMYKLYPPGMQIISLPWHHIDRVLRNLNEMPWTIPGHTDQKEEFYKIAHARLGVKQII